MLDIVQSGERLLNAFIFAVAADSADLDAEMFSSDRLRGSFDLFSPTLTFNHCPDVHH